MMELRGEADKWIKDIEGQERAYAQSLYSLLDDEQKRARACRRPVGTRCSGSAWSRSISP